MLKSAATVINIEDYSEYLRTVEVLSDPRLWGAEAYRPELVPTGMPWTAPVLPEIRFDAQGWSQQLKAADGSWFYIFRRTSRASGTKAYSLTSAGGFRETVQLSFAGALAAAYARIIPAAAPEPLNPDTITEADRRTNYGAY